MAALNDFEEVKAKPIQEIEGSLHGSGRSTSGRIHLPKPLKSMFKHKSKDGAESRLEHEDSEEHQGLCTLPLSLSKIKKLQLHGVSKQKDNPQVYKLHISKKFQDKKFARYAVGSPPLTADPLTMTSERVLMLVGATGTGKTTLINGIANYIYDIKWKDDFRLKVIHNESRWSQAYGQTKQISVYTFPLPNGSPLPYTLTVVDTPGFGDSSGVKYDRDIVEQINEFFSLKPPGGITSLHGIGFVVKASDARLTPMQLYIYNSILRIFGKDVEKNIFVIITFCDAEEPVVLSALKEAKIPFRGKGFKFNNSALFANKDVDRSENKDDNDDDDDDDDDIDESDFNSNFFEMGMKSFKIFFKHFEKAEAKSLQQTKEVLEERKRLEILIQGLRQQIVTGIGKIAELQQEEKVLRQHEADIEANKDFKYTVTVTEHVKVATTKRVTNCITCNFTCHLGCVYNKDKKNCRVIKHNRCIVCPGKCHYEMHINQPHFYEAIQMEEERTYEDLKARYDDATSKFNQSEVVLSGLDNELTKVRQDVMATVKEAHQTLQRLEEIALNPDPLTEMEYIKLCIETEKREAKPGWEQRFQYFEDLLKQNECISSVKELPLSNIIDTADSEDSHFDPTQHETVVPVDELPTEQKPSDLRELLSFDPSHSIKVPDEETFREEPILPSYT